MKTICALVVLSLVTINMAFGGQVAEDGTQSVLVQPVAPVVTAAPAVVVAAPPVVVVHRAPTLVGRVFRHGDCENGQCATRAYSTEVQNSEAHRHRLFGGTVTRRNSRTVVRPAR